MKERIYTKNQIELLKLMKVLVHDHGMVGAKAAEFLRRGGRLYLGNLTEEAAKGLFGMFKGQQVMVTIEEVER